MPGSYGYTGQHADTTTGLDYYNARYYDATAGQFASADTARDGLNCYGYMHGNPTTMTDPSGHGAGQCIIDDGEYYCLGSGGGGGGNLPPPGNGGGGNSGGGNGTGGCTGCNAVTSPLTYGADEEPGDDRPDSGNSFQYPAKTFGGALEVLRSTTTAKGNSKLTSTFRCSPLVVIGGTTTTSTLEKRELMS